VLLANDPEGISEVVNDLNRELTNFWQVMQLATLFEDFHRLAQATPVSASEWRLSDTERRLGFTDPNPVKDAHRFFIYCRQSLAGRMKGFTGITKTRTRRGMNNEVSAWLTCVEGLPAVHERLKRVLIIGPDDALNVIRKHDGPRTLFYADPPYCHSTRATTGEYAHEMSQDQHSELLMRLNTIKGRFLLSGYHSPLYDRTAELFGWKCHEKQINNHASGAKKKRVMIECIWCNY
jgi:DNA adenine methylase